MNTSSRLIFPLFCFLVSFSAKTYSQLTDTCVGETATFIKGYGERADSITPVTGGYSLCASSDGNIFVTGFDGLMMKITPSGKVLWSRTLDFGFIQSLPVMEIIEDSDGMLAGCGHIFDLPQLGNKCIVFRYNPVADAMLWVKVIDIMEVEAMRGIVEVAPGGNFLAMVSNTKIWELERNTGDFVDPMPKRYSDGRFVSMELRDGALYCAGASLDTSALMPHLLCKIDVATGTPLWARSDFPDINMPNHGYGDMTIDGDAVLSLFQPYSSIGSFAIQKSTLDGEPLWTKHYTGLIGSSVDELIVAPDGYITLGESFSFDPNGGLSRKVFIFKMDKNGIPLWGRTIIGTQMSFAGYASRNTGQKQVIVLGDKIFATTGTDLGNIPDALLMVIKLDMNGEVSGGNCDRVLPLNITVEDWPLPVSIPIQLQPTPQSKIVANGPSSTVNLDLPERVFCLGCPCLPVAFFDTIGFCPGDIVTIGGMDYSQPGTVFDTLPSASGCDTIVTYTLQYLTPSPSNVSIVCPSNITVEVPFGVASAIVTYSNPTASSDCPCGDADLSLAQGLPNGSNFPVGVTQVCYQTADHCGSSNSCCFTVTVEHEPADDEACDVKNTSCLKFEILGIFQNPTKQKTYRMRVTNNCSNPLIYTAFQLPDGLVADAPANNTVFTASTGRTYEVRNPNASPSHSIRFKTIGNGMANGESDVFEYTLPPQAAPVYIHAVARLEPQVFYETHLNVFNCPVQQIGNKAAHERTATEAKVKRLLLFPNPATDVLYADLTAWEGQQVRLQVFDALGRLALAQTVTVESKTVQLDVSGIGPGGLYTIVVVNDQGEQKMERFVRVEH